MMNGALLGAALRRNAGGGGGGNWWDVSGATVVAAYKAKGAASLAASYVNLANPGTYDITLGAAPSATLTDGWIFGGSTEYLKTGIVPTNVNWTMIVRYSTASGTNWMAGVNDSSGANNKLYLAPLFGGNRLYANGNNAFGSTGATSGVLAVAGTKGYADGADDGVTLGSYSGTHTSDIYLGACNDGSGGILSMFNGHIQAAAIYSSVLSAGNIATLTTAMNAL